MDENKRQKLKAIGYTIRESCGNCEHADIAQIDSYGYCSMHTYSHMKHNEQESFLSIHRNGWCPEWQESIVYAAWLAVSWDEFKEKNDSIQH